METTLKVLEIFSRNWIIIFSLVMVVPVARLAVNSYLQIKIAKIQNHNTYVVRIENNHFKKTLEISSSELSLKELKDHFELVESKNLMLTDQRPAEIIKVEPFPEAMARPKAS